MCIKKETKWDPECCFHSNSFAPVPFCQKTKKIPICNLYSGTKGPTWNRNSSHIVFSPVIRLGGVDSSCFNAKSGITVFIDTAPVAKLLSSLKGKKYISKRKHHSSVFLKAFQISTNYFSLHRHFKIQHSVNCFVFRKEVTYT